MANVRSRAEPGGSLSTTAIIAIVSAIGVVILGLLAALVLLLIRAVRRHKQLLADLDERGMTISQAQKDMKLNEVTRPRSVLRRNTILPFNAKSGWGTLPSVETIGSAAPSTTGSSSAPAHYVPPMPVEPSKRTSSLSWPFHNRKLSGHNMKMKKLKANRLSAVLEDPKPSSLVPILGSAQLPGSRPPLALIKEFGSQPSSCQSLLQYHPAFRNQSQDFDVIEPAPLGISKRLQRAKSVTEVPLDTERPQIRQRSTSLHSQASGQAPDVILPPLPLDIARIKDEASRKCELRHVPSKTSISSLGSIDSSILNPRPSPVISQGSNERVPKITRREWKNNALEKMNPLIEARESMYSLHGSMKSRTAEIETASPEARREFIQDSTALPTESSTHTLGSIHTLGSVGSVKRAESITMSRVVSACGTPPRTHSRTPKRRSKTLVTASGSPEKDCPVATNPRLTMKSPKRQTSRASSRSSCGNPFQWDPAPLTTISRPPSALKGSPGARQGHRRGHSVRISLVPTVHSIHSIRSRNTSPAFLNDEDRFNNHRASDYSPNRHLTSNTRALPAPPSSDTFAPELSFPATTLRASLTSTSAPLPLNSYDQTFVVAPTDQVLPELSDQEHNRLSTGSVFSLSRFPLPLSIIEPDDDTVLHIPDHSYVLPVPETPYLQQYPFRVGTIERSTSPSQTSLIDLDEYDPGQPGLTYQTPVNLPPRSYQSACTTIPEESSVGSRGTLDREGNRYVDSPPVSPKTNSPPRFTLHNQYNMPIHATTIPEEESPRTINPAVLSRDNFSNLNSGYAVQSANSSRTSIAIPNTPGLLDPLLNAAFPSPRSMDSPTFHSQVSSLYSSPSHSPHTSISASIGLHVPCSPRPAHASLPTLSLDFTSMPRLAPGPLGPRMSPPKPLRSSIQQLRRMNSDASDARKDRAGRGERRYIRLGRESSVTLPGEESWLDELDAYEAEGVELDDDEVRRLVGTVLEDWDEDAESEIDATMLDLEATPRAARALGGGRGVREDVVAGAEKEMSSIWDESDAFWSSSTPPPPPAFTTTTTTTTAATDQTATTSEDNAAQTTSDSPQSKPSRKRLFSVAKDVPSSETPPPSTSQPSNSRSGKKQRDSHDARGSERKRSVLGDGTPNVGAKNAHMVTSPVVTMTPGSYYDEQGFLRA